MSTKSRNLQSTVRTSLEPARQQGRLTWLEEMVVRMTRGVSETGDFELEFRGDLHADARARLALMEGDALVALGLASTDAEPDPGEDGIEVDGALKARILARLSGQEDG